MLAKSILGQHPKSTITVLVVDPDDACWRAAVREPFRAIAPEHVGLRGDELLRMAASYDLLEFATALKPLLLRTLVADLGEPVVYLDPDIELFASIEEAPRLAGEHGIVLTPHVLSPLPNDDFLPNEITILGSGIYNLGFIAVGPEAKDFLDWWAERLRRRSRNAKSEGIFVDQRWIDLVPTYFDPYVIRDPGWNVAHWNLPTRPLARRHGRYEVDGVPLRFFHFSGFDPDNPGLLSRYQGPQPRIKLSDDPVLAELCWHYAQALYRNGYRAYSRIPYGYGRSLAGDVLDHRAREIYRDELAAAEGSGQPEPPNPFDPDEAPGFGRWVREMTYPHDVAPREVRRPPAVNVAGYVRAESGVGQVARGIVATLEVAGIPHALVPFDATDSRQDHPFPKGGEPVHNVSIVCVNADQLHNFAGARPDVLEGRYVIGVWMWEVEELPPSMVRAADLVDEIWVPSEYTARAVRQATSKPVFVFPVPVVQPAPARHCGLDLPDGFTFLSCFDFDSVFERKNPLAVLEAFTRAFACGEGPHLVLKSVRGDAHPKELARLLEAARGRPDVHIIDGYLDPGRYAALVASCDVYVSLHRAEGFGLTMAEAMALARPVVATAWSGNLEFMDETNAFLVPFELVEIPPGCDPYPAGLRWAEPDVDEAARIMRRLASDPELGAEWGRRARDDVSRLHSPRARSEMLRERLIGLAPQVARPAPPPATAPARAGLDPRPDAEPALEWARQLLRRGPEVASPSRYGPLARRLRSLVLRILRHYDEHRTNVDRALLSSVEGVELERRDLELRLLAELQKLYVLEQRTSELERASGQLRRYFEEVTARLRDAEAALRRERRLRRGLEARLGEGPHEGETDGRMGA